MVSFTEKLVVGSSSVSELTVEERNLLSIAFKNVIGSLRAAGRIISSIEQKEESRKNEEHITIVKDNRSKVESEISDVCAGILKLLDAHLIPSSSASESKIFYLMMRGDFHMCLAKFKVGDERKEAAEDIMLAYKAAKDIAVADLPPKLPIRLGPAWNYSVFDFEILNSSVKAYSMAKQGVLFSYTSTDEEDRHLRWLIFDFTIEQHSSMFSLYHWTRMDEFNIINEVGSGAFGAVFAAQRKKNLEIVAIKKVWIHDNVITNHLAREIVLLADIRHPHLLRMDKFNIVREVGSGAFGVEDNVAIWLERSFS